MKKVVQKLIKFYQKYFWWAVWGTCRFTPTCSRYTYEAIERYGTMTGLYLGLKRFLRCNPLFKGGFDPVPKV